MAHQCATQTVCADLPLEKEGFLYRPTYGASPSVAMHRRCIERGIPIKRRGAVATIDAVSDSVTCAAPRTAGCVGFAALNFERRMTAVGRVRELDTVGS